MGEGARRILGVERDRFFGARAQLFGVGPAAVRHQEARKLVEGSAAVRGQPAPFHHRVADRIGRWRRSRDRRESHLGAITGHLFGGEFADRRSKRLKHSPYSAYRMTSSARKKKRSRDYNN